MTSSGNQTGDVDVVVQLYDSTADAQVLVFPANFSAANLGIYTCTTDYNLWGVALGNSSVLITDGKLNYRALYRFN